MRMRMAGSDLPVAIVPAARFDLFVAAHLRSCGMPFRILGTPMHRWLAQMLVGMLLKPEWNVCRLTEAGRYALQQFCADLRPSYGNASTELDTFTRCALSCQRHLFPMLGDVLVTVLERRPDGPALKLANGEGITAKTFVIAIGLLAGFDGASHAS
ncbi:hypothetical protein [Bradyrhizobium sp. STM 3562]|uniref:hypothetical protein n=1 Tax=Bradyrhizobium sp. STM 3562 TaxID=578924 RepID=UPI0038904084